jgi:hypothetical protein
MDFLHFLFVLLLQVICLMLIRSAEHVHIKQNANYLRRYSVSSSVLSIVGTIVQSCTYTYAWLIAYTPYYQDNTVLRLGKDRPYGRVSDDARTRCAASPRPSGRLEEKPKKNPHLQTTSTLITDGSWM